MTTCCYGKKALITGGCGFLGYHLIKNLLHFGAKVNILDLKNCSKKKIDEFASQVNLYNADVTDFKSVKEVTEEVNPDFAFHLAGYGIDSKDTDIEKAIKINVLGGANFAKALCDTNCLKLVNIGTSAEYGNRADKTEETLQPENIYGSSKAAATVIMHQIARGGGLGIVTLRPFNIYGEWEEPHKLFCNIVLNILNSKELNLTPCQQERDYVYVGDVAEAMIRAACSSVTDEVMDVASGEPKPIKHYVDAIVKAYGGSCKINYGALSYRKNEVFKHYANHEKIYNLLGWKAKTSLEDGIGKMLSWFKNNMQFYI